MRRRFIILATGPLVVALLLGGWLLLRGGKPQTLGLGMSLRADYPGSLLLTGCLTNSCRLPVHLEHCFWECEAGQGNVTNNAGSGHPVYQWTGVTNFLAPLRNSTNPSWTSQTDTLLANGVATISFRVPKNATRARLGIFYSYPSGFLRTQAGKVLRNLPLSRQPKTARWLDRHGLLGRYAVFHVGEWVSNSQGGANRSQPSNSDTNRASWAAASRRSP